MLTCVNAHLFISIFQNVLRDFIITRTNAGLVDWDGTVPLLTLLVAQDAHLIIQPDTQQAPAEHSAMTVSTFIHFLQFLIVALLIGSSVLSASWYI